MTIRQTTLILGAAVLGILVPWFSVGMFFMGVAVGGFLVVVLTD